jgi:hypothetical protein
MDDSARFLVSALILRVFFVTCFISVHEVAMPTKLELLLEKEAQLKAQIQQAKAAERTLEKKRDTRRKILVGAAVLTRVENGDWPKADLLMMMDGFLSRPHERELFGLDIEAEGAAAPKKEADKKAAAEPVKKVAKGKDSEKVAQTAGKTTGRLAEPDLDLNKEFNL